MTLADALRFIKEGYQIENKITHKRYWWDGKNIRTKEGPVSFDIVDPEQLYEDSYMFIYEHILSKRDKAALCSALFGILGSVSYIERLKEDIRGRYYLHLRLDFKDGNVEDDYYSGYIDDTWFSQMKEGIKYSPVDLGLSHILEGQKIGAALHFHKGKWAI